MLDQIDQRNLPDGYVPAKHQEYVGRRMAELTPEQRASLGRLWKEKQRIDPNMPNRGASFVRIMEYVAEGETQPQVKDESSTDDSSPQGVRGGALD